jgi:DNA invertase Pin-like site-specific DNA recombinase
LGFASREDLINALRSVGKAGSGKGRRGRGKSKGRRKRTTITAELRSRIEAAVRAGGKGQEVADKFDVSLPTVQNIKRAAGLTRKTKKRK